MFWPENCLFFGQVYYDVLTQFRSSACRFHFTFRRAWRRDLRIYRRLVLLNSIRLFALGGCAQPWQGFQSGQSESTLIAKLDPP
jgi:hypothetical protein